MGAVILCTCGYGSSVMAFGAAAAGGQAALELVKYNSDG